MPYFLNSLRPISNLLMPWENLPASYSRCCSRCFFYFYLLCLPLTVVYLFCVAFSCFFVFFQTMSISSHEDQVKICTYFLPHPLPSPFSLVGREKRKVGERRVCDLVHKNLTSSFPNRRSRLSHLGNNTVMSVTRALQRVASLDQFPLCSTHKSSPNLASFRKKTSSYILSLESKKLP